MARKKRLVARGSGSQARKIASPNVALYQPLQGRSYMDLPQKLKNKKAILNIQNRDNQCPRWALRAALFKPRGDMRRTSSYPTEDGLDFTGIDFPTGQYKMQTADRVQNAD